MRAIQMKAFAQRRLEVNRLAAAAARSCAIDRKLLRKELFVIGKPLIARTLLKRDVAVWLNAPFVC
jgi:hypothetical protein